MKTITLNKPEFIGTLPVLVERAYKDERPSLTYAEKKTLMRQFVGKKFLDKRVHVLRSPGNKKRIISVDETLPEEVRKFVEGAAIIRWVGEEGEVLLEPVK